MKWIVLCVTTESSRQSRYYSINTFYLESFKILCYKSMVNTVTSYQSSQPIRENQYTTEILAHLTEVFLLCHQELFCNFLSAHFPNILCRTVDCFLGPQGLK